MKFLKDNIIKFGETLIIGDFLRLEEDQDGRVSIRATGSGGSGFVLDDLTDVTISSPTTAQVLRYNGTFWANTALTAADIAAGSFPGGTFQFGGGKLLIDGTDSTISAGEIGLAENVGNLTISSRGSLLFDVDNDNNQANAAWSWTRHAGASTVMSLVEDGTLDLLGLFETTPVGAGFYVTMVGDAGVADRGGLLLNNTTSAARHWKQTATFTGAPGSTARYRAGWINSGDLETFLNSGPAIEVQADHDILLNQSNTGVVVIGADPGGSAKLRVGGGNLRVSNTLGQIEIIGTSTGAALQINGQAANLRDITWATNNQNRWTMRVNSAAESGANAGSNLELIARNDDGTAIDSWFVVNRVSSGTITFTPTGSRSVVIGVDPGGTEKLRVGGLIHAEVSTSNTPSVLNIRASAGTQNDDIAFIGCGGNSSTFNLLEIRRGGSYATETFTVRGDGQVMVGTYPGWAGKLIVGGNTLVSGTLSVGNIAPISSNDLMLSKNGRVDILTYNSAAALNEKWWTISQDGAGGASSWGLATRDDAGTLGDWVFRAQRSGDVLTFLRLAENAGVVTVGPDPGGTETLRIGGSVLILDTGATDPAGTNTLQVSRSVRVREEVSSMIASGTQPPSAGSSIIFGTGSTQTSFRGGWSYNVYWNGARWVIPTDGANSGGQMILGGVANDGLEFFSFISSGTATQNITNADIAHYRKLRLGATAATFQFVTTGSVVGSPSASVDLGTTTSPWANFAVASAGKIRWGENSGSIWPYLSRDPTTGGLLIGTRTSSTDTDRLLMSTTSFVPATAGGLSAGTSSLPWSTVVSRAFEMRDTSGNLRVNLSDGGGGSTGFELGRIDGTAAAAFIDFHTGTVAVDYDARLIGPAGGTGSLGGGSLQLGAADFSPYGAHKPSLGALTTPWGAIYMGSGYSVTSTTGSNLVIGAGGVSPNASSFAWGDNTGWVLNFGTRLGGAFLPRVTFFDTGAVIVQSGTLTVNQTITTSSTNAGLMLDNRSNFGVNPWILYNQTGADVRFWRGGTDYFIVGNTLVTSAVDFRINNLGTFDSTDTPTDQQILVYHAGSTNKWQAESVQFARGSGDFKAALLSDNTAAAYVFLDPGTGGTGSVNAPGTPTSVIGHKAITLTIPPSYVKTAQFRYFEWQVSINDGGSPSYVAFVNTTSRDVVHSRLTVGSTYRYRVRAINKDAGSGHSAFSSDTGNLTAASQSDVQAFAGIITGELATVDLTALAGDIGILIAGQFRGSANTYGINFGGVGGIPAGWTAGINFENTSLSNMTRYLNFDSNAGNGFLKHERLEFNYDGSVKMYQSASQPLFNLTASDFYLQNDSATPTQGILLDGTKPSSWLRYLDLVSGTLSISDGQASPILRVKVGQVLSGTKDYGLQVFDQDAATIMDFTGAKRILAIPVQPQVDNGGSSINLDLATGLTQQVRLTSSGSVILLNPVNGGRYRIWFQQDTVGSRAFPTIKNSSGDELIMFTNEVAPTLTTAPGQMDLMEFEYRTNPTARFTCMTLQTNVTPIAPRTQTRLTQAFASASTTHNVTMPSTVLSGELLITAFATDTSQLLAPSPPSGWTHLGAQLGNANTSFMTIFGKIANGTEDGTSVNFATTGSCTAVALTYRIDRWFGALSGVVVFSGAAGLSTTPDPPSNTPGWVDDRNLWIAFTSLGNNGTITVTAAPSNYTNLNNNNTGGTPGVSEGGAERKLYAATENPGTFTASSSTNWGAVTVAVRPPA